MSVEQYFYQRKYPEPKNLSLLCLLFHLSDSFPTLLKTSLQNSLQCWYSGLFTELESLFLFHFKMFPFLFLDAKESRCQRVKTQFGVGLRSRGENHLRLLEGTPSLQSCWAACCQDSACHAFWWLEGMCLQADCSRPQSCQAFRTDSSSSMLVFFKKFQIEDDLDFLPEDDVPHILGLDWPLPLWWLRW